MLYQLSTLEKCIHFINNSIYIYIYNNEVKSNNLYITLTGYDKFTKDILDAKIKEEKLINKSGFNERTKTLAAKKKKKR